MTKKLIFMIFILLLPIVFAETKIFSGKIITGTDKVIDGNTFRLTYDEQSDKVFVQNPSRAIIVENGVCKLNEIFKVCINYVNFSYKNITTYVYYYEVDATIYKLTGDLSAASTISSSTLLPNENAELKIAITNPTDFDITSIIFKEDLMPFYVAESAGCILEGNKLAWQGSLQPKYDKTCTAKIASEKDGTYTLSGNLSYFNGFETKKATTSISVTVLPKQLKTIQIADKDIKDIEVRQRFHVNNSLQNINKDEKIDLFLTIELPGNILLLKDVAGFSKDFNVLKRRLILEPGSVFNYSMYLEAQSEGDKPIKQIFDYTVKNIRDVIENNTLVNIKEPKLVVNFSSEYNELIPWEKFIVTARIRNPSKIYYLDSIKAKLYAPYNENIEQTLDRLAPGKSYAIISTFLTIPENISTELDSGNKIILNLSIDYTAFEIVKSLSYLLELKIKHSNVTITKTDVQIPQQAKSEEATANLTNKTEIIAQEKPKPRLFNKEILFIISTIIAAILIIFFIINGMRKRKKKKELGALKEIPKSVNK